MVDFHGNDRETLVSFLDKLVIEGGVHRIITGHGNGILKNTVRDLADVYKYKILIEDLSRGLFVISFED